MSTYKCWDCGAYFDEYDKVKEYRGEFWGTPAYETMCVCPVCGGDFDLAEIVEAEEAEDETDTKLYAVSAYTQWGDQFGDTIEAKDPDDLFRIFREKYPDCEIADYYDYAEEE